MEKEKRKKKIITRSIISFKKLRKMANDFLNNYLYVRPHVPVDTIRVLQ